MNSMSRLSVLYIEDDMATREALSKFLRLRVGRMASAASGEEGLKRFAECKPNLLIVDLIMPGMSGIEMIGEIRKMDRDCHIMITSTVQEVHTILDAVDLGIDHYIIKPIDTEELERKLSVIALQIESNTAHAANFDFMNIEKRGIIEDEIRREFLKIMKTSAGKGPQDVKVLLFENQLELTVIDAFTVMEKTVAANRKNISMAEQFRKLFYQEVTGRIEECAEKLTGCSMKLTSVEVDGVKRLDKIILTIN